MKNSYFLKNYYIFIKIYLKVISFARKLRSRDQSVFLYSIPFLKIKIWLNLKRDVDWRIYLGLFEFSNAFVFYDIIKPGSIIIDIGANIGFYSLLAAKKMQNTGKVYSLEPSKVVLKDLRKNIEVNKYSNIEVFNFAVSDFNGMTDFYRCEDDAYNSLIATPMEKVVSIDRVNVVTLDDFVKMNNIEKIDVIKIDAEGLDYSILKGAKRALKDFRPIIFAEMNILLMNKQHCIEFFNFLIENKYEVQFAKRNKFILNMARFEPLNNFASEIICFPQAK